MDAKRAQEIAFSQNMTQVSCNGKQVYIEHVDQDQGIATIHSLDDPNKKESVPVSNLMEQ